MKIREPDLLFGLHSSFMRTQNHHRFLALIFVALIGCGTEESEIETSTSELTPIGNQQYINAVYARLLARAPDPGAQGWVNLLNLVLRAWW